MSDRPTNQTTEPLPASLWTLGSAIAEVERLREFVREVAEAPDAMVCRLTRDAAKEVLGK